MLYGYAAYSGVSLMVSYTAAPTYPGVLSFTTSTMTVMENAGNAVVTVTRTGGSNGAASVLYSTSPGTALAGVDYTTTIGNRTWTDGDVSSHTISILIINNAVRNVTARSFTVNLSSAAGSTLGSPSSVTVSIQDDDGGSAPWLDLLLLGN